MTTKTIKEIKDDKFSLRYKGEIIHIDLTKELSISENIINSQLKESPSSYAFLILLKNKAIRKRDILERQKEVAYSEAYAYYKQGGGGITNELANNKANSNPKYKSIYKKYLRASHQAENLIGICQAYSNRERILQTISANIRKEH